MCATWHQDYTCEVSPYTLQLLKVPFSFIKEVVLALLILNDVHT